MYYLQKFLQRYGRGLWRDREFVKLWTSMTVTSFGAQVTNLALPLTAAVLLHASAMQMGVLVALETLPFALVSLHAGVLLDRVRKLPLIVMMDIGRGVALLALPVAAFMHVLSMEMLFAVGFLCGVQNVVGGAAYQVVIAQMAGRERLVEANAKITLGETSAMLVGPGLAGALIQALTAPFAIMVDAVAFVISAMMLRRVHAPRDVPQVHGKSEVNREIAEGFRLVRGNPTLWALAWLAGMWQFLHHMVIAVLILFATRELSLSAGSIGFAYACGGLGCIVAASSAEWFAARFGVGRVIVQALTLTAVAWQLYGFIAGPSWVAVALLAVGMFVFDFGGVMYGIHYLSLRQAITPDRLLGRMTATMRFLSVASAPVGSLVGGALASVLGLRATLLVAGMLGLALAIAAMLYSPVRQHRHLPMPVME